MKTPHWADVLTLRSEVRARRGHAEGLQMSLFDAVYQTNDVPYREASYWCDITQPTVKLTEFFAEIALCLSDAHVDGRLMSDSLFHLDQGMGGGKSHALCGLWHMAMNRDEFFASDVGQQVARVAHRRSGVELAFDDVRAVVMCADHFSPGVARPEFGPATTLHERFLWSLFDGDRRLYDEHVGRGTDKAAIKEAIAAADRPVLILLDEVMDYALQLAHPDHAELMPVELSFLNSLTEVVNSSPRTAMVVVMIRSDLDEQGYEGPASEFRGYLSRRLERNGTTVSVNEPQDFGAIIRRRIFAATGGSVPIADLAAEWVAGAGTAWTQQVFERLPGARQLGGFGGRLEQSYPFHPDLLDLIEHDWTKYAGFQRVRSTVEIFAASAHWWVSEHEAGRWAPPLIGLGDIPLHAAADEVLASGVLHGNESQRVGLRQIAEKDIASADRTDGQALLVDQRVAESRVWASVQPHPAVRLATALWMYSVVARAQGTRGATRPELLASIYLPDERFGFTDAEEVFNALTDDEDERGLGALDVIRATGGGQLHRYVLATDMNKRVFHRNALNRVSPDMSYELVWERAKSISSPGGAFNRVIPIDLPPDSAPLAEVFGEVDQQRSNRLVVLHPRRWTLLNGRDSTTRSDMEALLGLGPNQLAVDWAASCVVACVNTQRRDALVKKARNAKAWQLALAECSPELALHGEIQSEQRAALEQVDVEVRRAFQHYAFLIRDKQGLRLEVVRLEDDSKTSLSGNDVWEDLAAKGEAIRAGRGMSGAYLHKLVDLTQRAYTLKEVVEKFWRDPVFPMVAGEADVRAAIFDALRADEDGVTWELIDSAGTILAVESSDQLAIGSSEMQLRLAVPRVAVPGANADAGAVDAMTGAQSERSVTARPPRADAYSIYEMRLDSRSLSDPEYRNKLYLFLSEITDVVDPASGVDVQLASVQIAFTAQSGSLEAASERAKAADVIFAESEEDF